MSAFNRFEKNNYAVHLVDRQTGLTDFLAHFLRKVLVKAKGALLLLLLLASSLLMSSCATPARLVRTDGLRLEEGKSSRYMDVIALDPDSEAGRQAARRFLRIWHKQGQPADARFANWRVVVDGEFPAGYFDSLLPAEDFKVIGFTHRHTRPGRGVPLVGYRKNQGREPVEYFYPPEGICRPLTAMFKTEGDTIRVTLADPLRHEDLAADFTAPLASLMGRTGALTRMGFIGLLGRKDSQVRGHHLYLMEPYDANKIPIIFVHGLLSTPLAWAEVTNEVWGDAEFRRQHQVWHYLYPTSTPFLYSARMFRQRITEARHVLDPDDTDPASRDLDIVAHSMGGLLTRTLITDSGEAIWNEVFLIRPEELSGSARDKEEVYNILHWKVRPDARRIIFVATPHRGSKMSGGFIGRLGDKLAGLPVIFKQLYADLNRDNPEALHPAFRKALSRGQLTSIDTLSPEHPLLATLLTLPIAERVELHSIIGNRGREGPLAESSDGVVPYASSHLQDARSELIVPTGHAAMKHPDTVAEILRIMNQR